MRYIIIIILVNFLSTSMLIGQSDNISANIVASFDDCPSGSIDVTVQGGFEPYTFIWSDQGASTTEDIRDLMPGVYTVTVTDDLCGKLVESFTVASKGDYYSIDFDVVDACINESNGQVSFRINDEYSYPNGCYSSFTLIVEGNEKVVGSGEKVILKNLSVGEHCIKIKGPYYDCLIKQVPCEVERCFTVGESGVIQNISVENYSCNAQANGLLKVNFKSGSIEPYDINWDNSTSTEPIAGGLSAGDYCVTVTDGRGCQDSKCKALQEAFSLSEISVIKNACDDQLTGEATFKILGSGIVSDPNCVSYAVSWGDGQTMNVSSDEDIVISGMGSGNNCVTVTGPISQCVNVKVVPCTVTKCFEVDGFYLNVSDVENLYACKGKNPQCTGMIEVASNFTALEWDGPDNYFKLSSVVNGTDKSSNLCFGEYTILGAGPGCYISKSVTLCCCSTDDSQNPNNPPPPHQCNTGSNADISVYGSVLHDFTESHQGEISAGVDVTWNGQPAYIGDLVYSWTGPGGFSSSSKNLDNLGKGNIVLQ